MDLVKKSKVNGSFMSFKVEEFPQARAMELKELEDLLQLIISNQDQTLYHLERSNEHIYLKWIVIHDFFELNGLPIVLFVRTNLPPTRFIKCRPDLGKIDFVDKIYESSAAYIKIIKIKQLPFCLDIPV
ncbi:MAG: hypothetical protein ACTSRS_13240 [Candidatus Helarchaeota archaeon]